MGIKLPKQLVNSTQTDLCLVLHLRLRLVLSYRRGPPPIKQAVDSTLNHKHIILSKLTPKINCIKLRWTRYPGIIINIGRVLVHLIKSLSAVGYLVTDTLMEILMLKDYLWVHLPFKAPMWIQQGSWRSLNYKLKLIVNCLKSKVYMNKMCIRGDPGTIKTYSSPRCNLRCRNWKARSCRTHPRWGASNAISRPWCITWPR